MKFKFRIDDDDNWPSVPHGHATKDGNNYVIKLWTGEIYHKENRTFWKNAKKNEVEQLKADKRMIAFVEDCRAAYKERHPEMVLTELEGKDGVAKMRRNHWRGRAPRVITVIIEPEE